MLKDIQDEQGRDRFDWQMACPPVGKGQPKRTVCFGGNICIFRSTPERQRAAWQFIKFFISRDITAEWSIRTGYMPVRRSAADTQILKDFFAQHPRNRAAFDTLPYGVFEPTVDGWQAVREIILRTLTRICQGRLTPDEAAADLAREADRALAKR
jgi:ABC-type glycerol-3-phosphate transport system substrate-binding protein